MADKPRNTTAESTSRPDMLGWILGGNPSAIERQEAEGQRELADSASLPTDHSFDGDLVVSVLEAAGVKFGEVFQDDPMFQRVTLPHGWKIVPTDHSMWSDLVDDKGRKRAAIFYKAAFYDRRAAINLTRRYSARHDYDYQDKHNAAVSVVYDFDKEIYRTEPIALPKDRGVEYYDTANRADDLAVLWLNENFPKWEDPGAYWD